MIWRTKMLVSSNIKIHSHLLGTHDQCLQSSGPWDIDFLLHDRAFDSILEFEPLFHRWVIGIFVLNCKSKTGLPT